MRIKSLSLAAALFALATAGLPMLQAHAQSTTPNITGTDPVPPPPGTTSQDIVGTDPVPPPPGTTHLVASVPAALLMPITPITPGAPAPQDIVGTDPVPPPPGTTSQDIVGTDPVPPPPGTTHMITSVSGAALTPLGIL